MRDDVVDTLASEGKRVIFHAIISGGAAFEETVLAFKAMLDTFGDRAEFVVWTNPYFGALKATNGTLFDETPFWQATENRVSGVVRLEDLYPHYAGASFHGCW